MEKIIKNLKMLIWIGTIIILFGMGNGASAWMLGTTTNDATNVSFSSATLNGSVLYSYPVHPNNIFFRYGTQSGNYTSTCDVGDGYTNNYSCNITGLTPNTTYYFVQDLALDNSYTSYGGTLNEKSFTTRDASAVVIPTIVTNQSTQITQVTATANSTVTNNGGDDPSISIRWGTISLYKMGHYLRHLYKFMHPNTRNIFLQHDLSSAEHHLLC